MKTRSIINAALAGILLAGFAGSSLAARGPYHGRGRYHEPERPGCHGDLDAHGVWSLHASYGWVWRPSISIRLSSWHPYRYGVWIRSHNGRYWRSSHRWGYGVYGCGRWLQLGCGWVWAPPCGGCGAEVCTMRPRHGRPSSRVSVSFSSGNCGGSVRVHKDRGHDKPHGASHGKPHGKPTGKSHGTSHGESRDKSHGRSRELDSARESDRSRGVHRTIRRQR